MWAGTLRHVQAAAADWRRGDKALANLRLAFADMPRPRTPADADCLALAAHLLDRGMTPIELAKALDLDVEGIGIGKYSADEPRVPAGHGRESGEFGSGSGSGASAHPAAGSDRAYVAPLPVAVDAAAIAAGVLPFVAGSAAFALAMVFPTPNSGGVDSGKLPDMPDVRYRKDGPAGTLALTTTAPDGSDVSVLAQNRAGTYVDVRTDREIGRDFGSSISLDKPAVRAALDTAIAAQANEDPERKPKAATDEPEVCPAPEKDKPHGPRELEYESDVHARVNPEDPTKDGYAYRIWDPEEGKFFYVDDCFKKHGDLVDGDMKPGDFADAKGEEYEQLFSKPFAESLLGKLRLQGARQVRAAAARGARVKWYFAQKAAADFIRDDFNKQPLLKEITISHMPPRKGQ